MAKAALSRAIKLYGTDVTDGKKRMLNAGPITAMFDNGALRYIKYRGVEVLRGIAYLSRDKNWGTYAPVIEGLKVKQAKDGFSIRYTATCKDKNQGIRYVARIDAGSDGTLVFSADSTPLSDFLTNRTGFVVLHPLVGVVGEPVEIVHTDGKKKKARFPKIISPGQPVFEIRSLKHTVMPGVTATVLMEGNKFEMEDHRNWMDASYKTYVCSLLDPWPYTLKKGEAFTQSITLNIAGKPAQKTAKASGAISVTLGGQKGRIPSIGAGVPMAEAKAALDRADLIESAEPDHLICQIDGREKGQSEAAAMFRALREKTGVPAFLEIVLPAKAAAADEIHAIASELRAGDFRPDAIIVTQMHDLKSFQPNTPRPWGPSYEEMAAAVRASFPDVPLGGGMLSYFTELNRKRPPQGVFDFITHSVCPIVHAADDLSVMETLESLPSIFASARAMIGKTPYHIGPSSIPCRDNPYGAAVAANPGNGRVCLSDMDPRQRGLFAAAWNLGLIAAAAKAGLDTVAIGSVTGPQGAIYRKANYKQPWFDGAGAAVYPAYHILAGLGPVSGQRRLETASSAPSTVTSLAYATRSGPVLWLANLSSEAQKVKISGFDGSARIHRLSDSNFQTLAMKPGYLQSAGEALRKVSNMDLGPYAVARITAG
jgi:D-apionolactonase